jgi:hypothetical protein
MNNVMDMEFDGKNRMRVWGACCKTSHKNSLKFQQAIFLKNHQKQIGFAILCIFGIFENFENFQD